MPAPEPSDLGVDLKPLAVDPASVTDPTLRPVFELAARGKTLAGISLESRRSDEVLLILSRLLERQVIELK